MNRYIYIIMLFCFASALIAQPTANQHIKIADESYANGNYHSALVNYMQALKTSKSDASLWNRFGQAAMKQKAYGKAEKAFAMVVDSLQSNDYPDAIFNLGRAKSALGKYDEASTYYDLYTSQYSDLDKGKTKLAKFGKKSSQWALQQDAENEEYSIEKVLSGINTGESEHGPALLDDDLYFSSLRFGTKSNTACGYSKIMKDGSVSNKALKSKSAFNVEGMSTNSPAFSPDGSKLYYSVCDVFNVCDLYVADVVDGKVGNGMKLGGDINGEGYTSTQPSVSADGTLYFASNRPGGKGGTDIYMVTLGDGDAVGAVTAVEGVNTPGDDGTPFINYNGDLYFSSDGRVGFGGRDIYVQQGGEVMNLGAEINTSYDDLYFILNSDNSMGYLASNRPGSMFSDDEYETCCFDLYKVIVETCTVDLLAMVRDCSADEDLKGTTLTVTNNATGEVVYTDTKEIKNTYKTEFDCDNAYTITASKPGYTTTSINVGPYTGKRGKQSIEETLCLVPAILNVCVYTDDCSNDANGSVTLYNKTDGTQETCAASNCCSFELMSDKDYRMVTSKGGYTTDTQEFSTVGLSSVLDKKVCLDKAVPPCSSMVPVRLYFDNDYPNPRSTATTTSVAYGELNGDYYDKKAEFIRKYGGKFGGKVRESVEGELGSFFDNEVAGGYSRLNRFLECMLGMLQSGQSANLFLRGYASPLARDQYNEALTQRRVESVKNEIRRYRGGVLAQYLDNGQLKLTERAFGETLSPEGISDSYNNKRKSVYSPEASRERRVEIDEIKFNN